jgi:transposase
MEVTSATVHETKPVLAMVDRIHVQPKGRRFKRRPERLMADRGYDSMALRRQLRERAIQPIIPGRVWKDRKRKTGRPPGSFAPGRYKGRWKIERTNAWMDNYRRVAVRWDQTLNAFKAFATIACIAICLNNILR